MKIGKYTSVAGIAIMLSVWTGMAMAQQDRYTVKALNGISFSEFQGYDNWADVAVSATESGIKAIVANPTMISAYKQGIPGNHQAFPDGSMIAKIEWTKKKNPVSPYFVEVPDTLKSVAFIEKDSKRFPDTNGWGYAQFLYDPATGSFTPYGKDASFGKTVCHQCHTAVTSRDFIFTNYPLR